MGLARIGGVVCDSGGGVDNGGKKVLGAKGMLASVAMTTVARAVPSGLRSRDVDFMCAGRRRESEELNRRDAEDAERDTAEVDEFSTQRR